MRTLVRFPCRPLVPAFTLLLWLTPCATRAAASVGAGAPPLVPEAQARLTLGSDAVPIRWHPAPALPGPGGGEAEAWFALVAPSDGDVVVRVEGRDPATAVSVFTGEPPDQHILTRGARPDRAGAVSVRFTARAGSTYRVRVTGRGSGEDAVIAALASGADYTLKPYSLHLSLAGTNSAQLTVYDLAGNAVSGGVTYHDYDTSLVSVSATGLVTALRAEGPDEIGTWIRASVDGQQVDNAAVARVLSADPDATFAEHVMPRSVLWSPTEVAGENLEVHVLAHQIPLVDDYVYADQRNLMGTHPFRSQVLAVDFGESESSRVCGISGNPVRLGWNLEGSVWNNCFLVPFVPPRSPQWFVFHHEIGHNTTWNSGIFGQGLGHFVYSEGLASYAGLTSMARILDSPDRFPLGATATDSLALDASEKRAAFAADFAGWVAAGASFAALDPNIVDGLLISHEESSAACFAERLFNLVQPRHQPALQGVLDAISTDGDRHTFFAAAVSAAAQTDLHDLFASTYHYPLNEALYPQALTALDTLPTTAAPQPTAPADGSTRQWWPVILSWVSSPGALAYDLYFGAGDPPALYAQGLFETEFRIDTLTPGTSYHWRVEAQHPCAGTLAGPLRSFTTALFQAEPLFDNGPRSGGCCSEMSRYTLAEDFELTTPERIVSVRYLLDDGSGSFPANWDGELQYWVFQDLSGFPGAPLAAGAGALIEAQPLTGGGYAVLFDLAQPFDARPGRRYWLALHMTADWSEEHGLYWSLTDSGFGETARVDDGSGSGWSDSAHHLAFALLGDPRYIFADGFESAGTGDWSATLPHGPEPFPWTRKAPFDSSRAPEKRPK